MDKSKPFKRGDIVEYKDGSIYIVLEVKGESLRVDTVLEMESNASYLWVETAGLVKTLGRVKP